jgi:hypothetical protein
VSRNRSTAMRNAALCIVGLACLAAVGCGGSKMKAASREQSNLKALSILYCQFLRQHRGRPPANEAEFKQFVRSLFSAGPTSSGGKNPDDVFVSSRDGKPYVVLYGRVQGPPGPGGTPVVAYEQEGAGGMRLVAGSMGAVEDVDQARFRELVPSAATP